MEPNDQLLNVMKELTERWIKVPQKVNLFGQINTEKPFFLSITYKELESTYLSIVNGAVIGNPKGTEVSTYGYSIKAMIGDKEQGYGLFMVAAEEVPRKISALRNILNKSLDGAVKGALQSYLDNIEESIRTTPEHGFYMLSKDPISVYGEKKPEYTMVPQRIIKAIAGWSKKISGYDHIDESKVEIRTNLEARRFVDSQGRKIKDYTYLGYMVFDTKVKHNNNFHIDYRERLALAHDSSLRKSMIQPTLENIIEFTDRLKTASIPESGQYFVIFGPKVAGTFFHEALGGHLLSGKHIAKGDTTVYRNKINQIILPEFLTILDDPQKAGAYGSYVYDEEGIEGKKIVLVENGRLLNYLLDRHSAPYFGMKSNGHSRAEWVVTKNGNNELMPCEPEPRSSNLEVISTNAIADDELMEIMKKYCLDNHKEYGIYLSDTYKAEVEVNPKKSSEITLHPSKAWKIYPDGKKEVITSFIVVGNPYELLSQISCTGQTREAVCGDCGGDSGDVPSQEISPAIILPKVTIQAVEPTKYARRLL
jgi:predicted Zn-dependent protease